MSQYMYRYTKLPQYLPMPKFLTELPLSNTARYIYTLLLNRAQYSQMKEMVDEQGRVYIFYPVHQIAEKAGKGETTVKVALNQLVDAGILEKVSEGRGRANRLYVLFPDEEVGRKTDVGKLTEVGQKAVGYYGSNQSLSKYTSNNRSSHLRNYDYEEEESF